MYFQGKIAKVLNFVLYIYVCTHKQIGLIFIVNEHTVQGNINYPRHKVSEQNKSDLSHMCEIEKNLLKIFQKCNIKIRDMGKNSFGFVE